MAMTNPLTRLVPVPGGRLHAVEEGAGPPVVLLHAGIADLRAWESLVPLLVAAGYRTIRYDQRGFGRSETDAVEVSNRADVIAVLDAFGIGRACLVGNSRGGQIAIDTAVEFPDRVAALVTLGAGLGGFEADVTPAEMALFERAEAIEEAGDPEAIAAFDVGLWGDGPGQPEGRLRGDLRETLLGMARTAADPSREHGTPIPLEPRAASRLDALTMPVLALAGALDVSDTTATAKHLAASVANGRAVVLENVAHMMAMEAPEWVAALIVETLAPLGDFDGA
jgi:pimeloyl-ACP methyl ester carboxylesterase